jgi:hypothetical protein
MIPELPWVFDASLQIPATAPEGALGVAGYIGGQAEHVWLLEEWQRFGHLRQFPIWVANTMSVVTATGQAVDAVTVARRLGWHEERAIICDMENTDSPGWWDAWAVSVAQQGYFPVWYGSADARPATATAVWLADPDGVPELTGGVLGKQFAWDVDVPGGLVDWSVVSEDLFHRGGEGPRG